MKNTKSFYITEISKYPTLSESDQSELCARYNTSHSTKDLDLLVKHNMRLALSIANQYLYDEDIIAWAMLGLVQGIKKFDPARGTKLSTYVTWWVNAYILKYILDNSKLVKLGTTAVQKKLFYNLEKVKAQLRSKGEEITSEVIANQLQVNESDVVEMEQRMTTEVRLSAPVGNDGSSKMDFLSCEGLSPDEAFEEIETKMQLDFQFSEFRKTLSPFEVKVFNHRLIAEEDQMLTLREIGDSMGMSHESARLTQLKIKPKLKSFLQRRNVFSDL